METARDLYERFSELCGRSQPWCTQEAMRDEFHARGHTNYRREGEQFLDEIFSDGWAVEGVATYDVK